MFAMFVRQIKPAALVLVWMTLLTGVAYPLGMTAVGRVLFPFQAGGSLIAGKTGWAGSELIGQPFASPRYFWSRPSATAPNPYNAASSAGSNLGPSNPDLAKAAAERAETFAAANGGGPVPMDLATTSASGLDPHISPQAAAAQVARVARERGLSEQVVAGLVARHTKERLWGFWGEPRVNVLRLNLALDEIDAGK